MRWNMRPIIFSFSITIQLLTKILSGSFSKQQRKMERLVLLPQRFILPRDMNFTKIDIRKMKEERFFGMREERWILPTCLDLTAVSMRWTVDNTKKRKRRILPAVAVCWSNEKFLKK